MLRFCKIAPGRFRRVLPAVFSIFAVVTTTAESPQPSPAPGPSNVLFVTLDTTRADRLGCYGDAEASTPHLDRIAGQGVRFLQAESPVPLTLPAHASIFSGTLPRNHGVRDNSGFAVSKRVSMIAEAFLSRGYNTSAFVSSAVVERGHGLERGFQHYDDRTHYGSRESFQYVERGASQVVDAAILHLKELPEPWFLWVHFYDPHAPYVPPQPFRARFANDPYRGEIAFVDQELGRLLAEVRRRSTGPPTIFVAGDHGESLGEHGEQTHGLFVYEATTRVPWLIEGPGLPAGKTVAGRVSLIDLAPTLIDLFDLEPTGMVDGISRRREIMSVRVPGEAVELETFMPAFTYGLAPLRAIVEDDFKYIEAPTAELYNLRKDPGERTNLALRDPDRLRRMRRELRERVQEDEPVPLYRGQDDTEQRRRLESLGYLTGGMTVAAENRDPKDAVAAVAEIELGRKSFYEGRADEACERLENVLRGWPAMTPARLLLVRAHAAAGRRAKALFHARKAWSDLPGDPLVGFHLAGILATKEATQEELTEAAGLYRRVLAADTRNIEAVLELESVERRRNDSAAADAVILRALELGLADPTLFSHRGLIALRTAMPEGAVAWFNKAEALSPCEPGVAEALGRLAELAGQTAEMRSAYERAWRCDPDAGLALGLGDAWRLAGRRKLADEWYRRVLDQAPEDSELAGAARSQLERN